MLLIMIVLVLFMIAQQYVLRGPFFRRRVRNVKYRDGDFLVPVDSYLVYARSVIDGAIYSTKLNVSQYLGSVLYPCWHLGFYMTTFDRHFAVAPCDCRVVGIDRLNAGVNLPMLDLLEYTKVMFLHRFDGWLSRHLSGWLSQNERVIITFAVDDWSFMMVLIGDKYVNKIEVFKGVGEQVCGGEVVGYIHRGSQVDLVVPADRIDVSSAAVVNMGLLVGNVHVMKRRVGA